MEKLFFQYLDIDYNKNMPKGQKIPKVGSKINPENYQILKEFGQSGKISTMVTLLIGQIELNQRLKSNNPF